MSPVDIADKQAWSAAKKKWEHWREDLPSLTPWDELPEHVRLSIKTLSQHETERSHAMDALDRLVPELQSYARTLIEAGFTVYVPSREERQHTFFHYSRVVDERPCYGTVQRAAFYRLGQPLEHTMPINPSRADGSAAVIGARFGDIPTFGLDTMDRASVNYAQAVARPSNWCPYLDNGRGAHRPNRKPSDLDTRFTAVSQVETVGV